MSEKRTKAETYRPKRKPLIATADEREALFAGAPSPIFRAVFMIGYYTGARPESETLQLRHGDVVFSDPKVRGLDGEIAMGQWIC